MRTWLFTTDPGEVARGLEAGISGAVVDWEWRGKDVRQKGWDTEINRDTPADLEAVAAVPGAITLCRINAWGPHSPGEVEEAVRRRASVILLPMVRSPSEVEGLLRCVDGRCSAGILVETVDAVDRSRELAGFPLEMVYVGLNDLCIDRKGRTIFDALVDGTVERLREIFSGTLFGFAGLTVVDRGEPVPCRLLLAEMVRIGCDFTFLRRSFRRDIAGRDWGRELARLAAEAEALAARGPEEALAGREAFARAVERWGKPCRRAASS